MASPAALACAAALAAAALAFPAPAATPLGPQPTEAQLARGKGLVETRCTACHGRSRVATAGRTEAAWRDTVTEMIRLGAELDDDEAAAVVAYLAAEFPGRQAPSRAR